MEKLSETVLADGLHQRTYFDGERMHIRTEHDITPSMEYAQALRNDDEVWKRGVKNERVHVAHIPSGVVHELLAIGISVYTAPMKDIVAGLHKINRAACLTTTKRIA